LSFPPPHPRNRRIVPTIAPAITIAARIVHLLFPPGSTSGPGFVGVGAAVGMEFLGTLGNVGAVAASGNSGRTVVSTMGSVLSFADAAVSSSCGAIPADPGSAAVCAITGARLRAIVIVHDITADNFGCCSLILDVSSGCPPIVVIPRCTRCSFSHRCHDRLHSTNCVCLSIPPPLPSLTGSPTRQAR
jgi:hypothetical protein